MSAAVEVERDPDWIEHLVWLADHRDTGSRVRCERQPDPERRCRPHEEV